MRDDRLYKRGRVWWCWYYDREGVQVRESTRCTDRRAAEARADELERAAVDPVYARRQAARLSDALTLLTERRDQQALEGERSTATAAFYRQKAGHWVRILGADAPLAQFGAADVDRFVTTRRGEGMTDHTIAKELTALRVALKLARREGIWEGDPAALLPVGFSTGYKPRERVVTWDDIRAMLSQLEPDRAARLAFILATGARLGETARALRTHIGAWTVVIDGTKTEGAQRSVPIVTEWQQELLLYALEHAGGVDGKLFRPWGKLHRDVARACRRAGCDRTNCDSAKGGHYQCQRAACAEAAVVPSTPNDWRRTCATWLRTQGVPVELIALVLGHADDRMAQVVYARLRGDALGMRLMGALGCDNSVIDGSGLAGLAGPRRHENRDISRENGGSCGGRSRDQRIKSPLLYRLS